jgi:bifunctional non-homologous end joining protein LigD
MALEKYNKKRKFDETTEPKGKTTKGSSKLKFVVQKHDASSLHYDFRLELNGVMLSWAVPKGPTLNPKIKHLAMKVEDHPLDYRNFEGIIPKGNYGAGEVIVWDKGYYNAPGVTGKKKNEEALEKALKKGDIKIILHGEKLNGEFALVHMKSAKQDNAWLLIKKKDEFATTKDILKEDESVLSGVTIEDLREEIKPGKKKFARKKSTKTVKKSSKTKSEVKKKPRK